MPAETRPRAHRGGGRISISAPCGIASDGDDEPVDVAEAALESAPPGADAVGVAAPAICEDDELRGVGVAAAAFSAPPGIQGFKGEGGGVGGDAGVAEAPDSLFFRSSVGPVGEAVLRQIKYNLRTAPYGPAC